MKPRTTATRRPLVIVSLRSGIASSATQAGVVNSSAKTVASGRSVRPKAHPSVAAKWITLRARWSLKRRGFSPGRSSGLTSARASRIRTPAALRTASISKIENVGARARTAMAVAEKDEESAAHPEDDGEDAAMGHGGPDDVNASSDYPASSTA